MQIDGLEANLLLFGLDKLLGVDDQGKLRNTFPGYTIEFCQSLRDRLFGAHEHPPETEDIV